MSQKIFSTLEFLPSEILYKIASDTNCSHGLALTSYALRELVSEVALNTLKNRHPSICEREKYLMSPMSDRSLSSERFSRIFSEIVKDILSMPDGRDFLEELQYENSSYRIFHRFIHFFYKRRLRLPISFQLAEQMLEWKKDKNFVIFWNNLNTLALDIPFEDYRNADLKERAKKARVWMVCEDNQTAPSGIEKLNLENLKLTELPPEIGYLTALTRLCILESHLVTLPQEIGNLTSLCWMSLWKNRLTFLPKEIGRLSHLKFLNLSNNQLSDIPSEIGQLTSLKVLSLDKNHFTFLPSEIDRLVSLEDLYLSYNDFQTFPKEIGKLTSLRRLNLSGNKIKELSSEIGNLRNLKLLNLSYNQLKTLPQEIGNLICLDRFCLFENHLREFPPEICNLTSLQELHLNGNELTGVPKEVDCLISLRVLDLKESLYSSLPDNRLNNEDHTHQQDKNCCRIFNCFCGF